MKIDLHCHSKYSGNPSEWILQKLGCPESFTEPERLVEIVCGKGMTGVTITDHDSINGCLDIAHLSGTFISEEVTTYFPENRCKLHVLVYNIREKHHAQITKLRQNVYDLVNYLNSENIVHALAHPLFSINGKMNYDNFERALLLFRNFELNGSRNEYLNEVLKRVCAAITEDDMYMLMEKHKIQPSFLPRWEKNFIGGSDDHSSLTLAERCTEVPEACTIDDFFKGVQSGKARVIGKAATPQIFARNLYSIAYQFYKNKKRNGASKDILDRALDRLLLTHEPSASTKISFFDKVRYAIKRPAKKTDNFMDMLRTEIESLFLKEPRFKELWRESVRGTAQADKIWFEVMSMCSNGLLTRLNTEQLRCLFRANFLGLTSAVSQTALLYLLLTPYILAYSLFSKDLEFGRQILRRFGLPSQERGSQIPNVGHFTDTFYETNGVAKTLQRQSKAALACGKNYEILTCSDIPERESVGVKNFKPLTSFRFEEYRDQKFVYPPFLEILEYCYTKGFTHIHSSTPGPMGLAALAVSKLLKLPIMGTYHTAFPEYVSYFTTDNMMENTMWQYMLWYYGQMNHVYSPSRSTMQGLLNHGFPGNKISTYPRGVNIKEFTPQKRNSATLRRYGLTNSINILYAGRISREKNLNILTEAFKKLSKRSKSVQLVVAGDGPYKDEMEKELSGFRCIFTGTLDLKDLSELYASCDVFVFPSVTDTFGNAVLEAQASGIPAIVTDTGGPAENVIDRKTGWIIKGNDEDALYNALRDALSFPERLSRYGQEARRMMETRSFEKAFLQTWNMMTTVTRETDLENKTQPAVRQCDTDAFDPDTWVIPSLG